MAAWSGFTDEDLRKMRQTNSSENNSGGKKANKPAAPQRIRLNKTSPPGPALQKEEKDNNKPDTNLGTNAGASANEQGNVGKDQGSIANGCVTVPSGPSPAQNTEFKSEELKEIKNSDLENNLDDIKELNEMEAISVELNNVQKFHQQQKVIEAANKHKRALLAQAIENRKKKAEAEAEKLMKVQQELNHLDTLLTADVSIIRDRIEVASLEYNEAQKRYEKAEKEFIAAKMDLFSKGEVKEQLTEHLYTIIHQNEIRKAKKLVELMEKLAMEVSPDEWELTIPVIPQLTNFTAVSTLHGPSPGHRSKPQEASSPGNERSELHCDDQAGDNPKEVPSVKAAESQNSGLHSDSGLVDVIVDDNKQTSLVQCADSELHPPELVQDINTNIPALNSCELTVHHSQDSVQHDDVNDKSLENIQTVIGSSPISKSSGWRHPFS